MDKVKVIMHENLEKVFENLENLDQLVSKSKDMNKLAKAQFK